jgi:hypothetical protein
MTGTSEEPSSALEDLLVEALERFERDGPSGVEDLLERHPAHAARVRSYLGRVHRLGLVGGGADAPRAHPERLGEFRILAVLGQGGMGVVYRAVQESLTREVALKLVRPELLFFPGARERFQREVELVARLQHKGIVPVHAVGNEGGVPYFAMELVRGATLAEVLEDLGAHEAKTLTGNDLDRALAQRLGEEPRDEPAPLFRGPWSEVVLRLVRELADALEHAHRHGVLHRDVKPSNVMVTREGRVLLLDFGLAGARGAERTTRTGSQIGSLAYMAPELLTGEPRELDVRGDVYALGATAWELLTLRLPYASSDPIRLRELAGTARRPRLDSIQPGLGWDVETVIATALEPDPERRYASAAQLSRDVDHLLARRPIEAREIGPGLRLRRWSQRHPARATALVALALALVLGPLAWARQQADARARVQKERDALAAANTELTAARAQAERHFHAALSAIGHVLRSTASDELADVPRLQQARLTALERALEVVADVERDRRGDRTLLAERAALQTARAEVFYEQGRFEEGLADCRAALASLGEEPRAEDLDTLHLALHAEAKLLQGSLRWPDAALVLERIENSLRTRLATAPQDADLRRQLAVCLADKAQTLGRFQGAGAGRAELEEGYALARALAAEHSGDPDFVWVLGRLASDLSDSELVRGEFDEAARLIEESYGAFLAAAELDPGARFPRAEAAAALGSWARIDALRGRPAEPRYLEALELLGGLAREFPESVRYRLDQARLFDELAVSLGPADPARAEPHHRLSLEIYAALLAEQPDDCRLRSAAAVANNNLANQLIHRHRDFEHALEACERGLALIEPCRAHAADDEQVADAASRLAYLHALALCQAGEHRFARGEIEAFEAAAGDSLWRWRFASDLWTEWTLAVRRDASLDAAASGFEDLGRERMLGTLRRAIELGYSNLEELRTTPSMQPFLRDPEVAELLAGLERGG